MAALLAIRKDGLPADFEYVWKGISGVVMVLPSRTYMQMMQKDLHIVAGVDLTGDGAFDEKSTGGFVGSPESGYLASWVGSKQISIWGAPEFSKFALGWVPIRPEPRALFQYGLSAESRKDPSWDPLLAAIVPRPPTGELCGKAIVKFGDLDEKGHVQTLMLFMANSNNTIRAEAFDPLFSLDRISVAGKWKDDALDLDLEDTGGRVGDVKGTVTSNGVRHRLKGRRLGARCAFGIFGEDSNNAEGCGYVEWAPTSRRADEMKEDEKKKIDRIFVGISLPPDLAGNIDRIMTRQ